MIISSPAFQNSEPIPLKYTCDGENISPPLVLGDVHPNTKSIVLVVDDPDAPGETWVHWVVWNIHPTTREIPEGTVPTGGLEGKTSFNSQGYGGPCPHQGTHRYFFRVYALDTVLVSLPLTSDEAALQRAMQGHIITDAKLIGTYERK